ncbi:MAG: porin [Arcobacteraceae bacterium]
MKKIVKMSLVAAVAVAGLTAANAKPLEEAIKDVEVSGTVVYRYNDYNADSAATAPGTRAGTSDQTNNYKIGLNISSKVNDDVKLNTRFLVANDAGTFAGAVGNSGGLNANSNDANPEVSLSQVYFTYTGIMNTTVNVGKQGLTTPWTTAVDSDGNEQNGTGILALSTWGPVTVAGAYFNQTNLDASGDLAGALNGAAVGGNAGATDIITVGVLGNVGPVSLNAWYLDMADLFDTYTLGAKAGFDVSGVKLGADLSYTSVDFENRVMTTDNNLLKLVLTAKAGIVDAKYVYAGTDKEGGITALDADAATTVLTWNITTLDKADADLHHFSVGVQALDTVHVSANYTTMDYNQVANTADEKEEELYAQVVYNMSKNLMTYVRFGTYEAETNAVKTTDDSYRGRLQVQYSF